MRESERKIDRERARKIERDWLDVLLDREGEVGQEGTRLQAPGIDRYIMKETERELDRQREGEIEGVCV